MSQRIRLYKLASELNTSVGDLIAFMTKKSWEYTFKDPMCYLSAEIAQVVREEYPRRVNGSPFLAFDCDLSSQEIDQFRLAKSTKPIAKTEMLGTMSMAYWDLADEFSSFAIADMTAPKEHVYSKYVFPAIVFLCASVESLVSEQLALIAHDFYKFKVAHKAEEIRLRQGKYRDLFDNFSDVLELLKRSDIPSSESDRIVANQRLLNRLRNAIVHFNPEFLTSEGLSDSEKHFFRHLELIVGTTDWTIWARTLPLLLWARRTAKSTITFLLQAALCDPEDFFQIPEAQYDILETQYRDRLLAARVRDLQEYLCDFDPQAFAETILVQPVAYGRPKPGDDETLTISCDAKGIPTDDQYLVKLLQHDSIGRTLYDERAFAVWQDIYRNYLKTDRARLDAERCLAVQSELRDRLRLSYSREAHEEALRGQLTTALDAMLLPETDLNRLMTILRKAKTASTPDQR